MVVLVVVMMKVLNAENDYEMLHTLSMTGLMVLLAGIRSAYVVMLWTFPLVVVVYSIDVGSMFSRKLSRLKFLHGSGTTVASLYHFSPLTRCLADFNVSFFLLFALCCIPPVLYWVEVNEVFVLFSFL